MRSLSNHKYMSARHNSGNIEKNEITQLLIPDLVMKLNFTDVSAYQNVENVLTEFDNIISLFNLFHKGILAKNMRNMNNKLLNDNERKLNKSNK